MARKGRNDIMKTFIAGAGAGLLDAPLQDLAARFGLGISDDIIRVLALPALNQFNIGKTGLFKDVLQALAILGAANIGRSLLSGSGLSGLISGMGTMNSADTDIVQ